ncbi:MAG: hypothetical protein ABRQ38_18375 [Candidatus Eremiobacterota bacterium]
MTTLGVAIVVGVTGLIAGGAIMKETENNITGTQNDPGSVKTW